MPQLNLSTYPDQIFWLLATFLALFFLVRFFVVPRMSQIFDARWERQDNAIQRANELKAEAEKLLQKTEKLLSKSKEEANQIIRQCEFEIKSEQEKAFQELHQSLLSKVSQAEKKINDQKNKLIMELPDLAKNLADFSANQFENLFKKEVKK